MLTATVRRPLGPLVVFIAGMVGVLLSVYSYVTPLTGITGTPGALLVIASSIAIMADALILWRMGDGAAFWIFWILGVLGAIGTAAAAAFLHSWWLLGINFVVLAGLISMLAARGRPSGAAA